MEDRKILLTELLTFNRDDMVVAVYDNEKGEYVIKDANDKRLTDISE